MFLESIYTSQPVFSRELKGVIAIVGNFRKEQNYCEKFKKMKFLWKVILP